MNEKKLYQGKAPVALFVYKRVDKLIECLTALEKNHGARETILYIFCDGPKKKEDTIAVQQVREYIHAYKNKDKFKDIYVIESEANKGLANSIIGGVTEVVNKHGKVIVVEDDLITTQDFLQYMNDALDFYEDMKEYGSISAYTLPMKQLDKYPKDIYVTRKGECWGWGTWQDRWNKVDWSVSDYEEYYNDKKRRKEFDSIEYGLDRMLVMQMEGKIDSWAVRWCYHLFFHNLLTVYPKVSKTLNIGFDGSGTHCETDSDLYGKGLKNNVRQCNFERLPVNSELERKSSLYIKNATIKNIISQLHKRIFMKK